jgi:hypothetical protein
MAPGIERLGSWICCAYLGRGLLYVQEVLRTASTASGPAYRGAGCPEDTNNLVGWQHEVVPLAPSKGDVVGSQWQPRRTRAMPRFPPHLTVTVLLTQAVTQSGINAQRWACARIGTQQFGRWLLLIQYCK